jgi:glycerol-3-phosphate dehydrogenase (NAD(P)+)
MGLVLAAIAASQDAGHSVAMWCHDPASADAITQTRRSPRLEHFVLPESVRVTAEAKQALHPDGKAADIVLSAAPTQFTRGVWERLSPVMADWTRRPRIVSVSKGFESATHQTPTAIIASALEGEGIDRPVVGVLSGPTIAGELGKQLPATMIAASGDAGLAAVTQELFTTSWMRVYTGTDPLGVEVAGACKNVIAIAAGILDGLRAGYNAKSALLARGLAEITRLGVAMGANADTFFGVAGAGDLATTCFSPEGRNRNCGESLGKGMTLADHLERTQSVVEGVATARCVAALSAQYGVDMPICATVNAVLHEGLEPIEGIQLLMTRPPKAEEIG